MGSHEESVSQRLYDRLFRGLLLLMVAAVLVLFQDFGVTWDEPNQSQYGKYVLQYYESLGRDRRALDFLDAYLYGGLFDGVAALLVRFSPLDEFATRHLLNGLVGVAGVAGTWKLARLLGGGRAGLLAAVLLTLEPNYFGQMFNNHKDVPFAVGYVWSVAYLVESLAFLPKVPWRLVVRLGLAIGLTLGVRVGGYMLLSYVGLAGLLYLVWPAAFGAVSQAERRPLERLRHVAGRIGGVGAIAYALMLACWPWAQQQPLTRPLQALAYMSRFQMADTGLLARVLFDGRYVFAKDLPATYLPLYFWVKMPEVLLAGLGCAVGMAAWALARGRAGRDRTPLLRWGALVLAAGAPGLYAIAVKAVLYDALRHFTFVIPFLCVAVGVALHRLACLLSARVRWRQWAVALALGAALLPQTVALVRLHPNQYVYYNSFVGGVAGAQGRFELDYWGNSYKEAVALLVAYLARPDAETAPAKVRVAVWGPVDSAAHYFPAGFERVDRVSDADFLITFTRWGVDRIAPGRRVAAVERMGAVLSVVQDLRRP